MTMNTLQEKIKHIYKRMNGCTIEYNLAQYYPLLDQIKNVRGTLKNKT